MASAPAKADDEVRKDMANLEARVHGATAEHVRLVLELQAIAARQDNGLLSADEAQVLRDANVAKTSRLLGEIAAMEEALDELAEELGWRPR